MSLFYIVVAGVVAWLLWRMFSSSASRKAGTSKDTYEIPITIKVTCETDNTTKSRDSDDDTDNWEGSFWEAQQPFPAKATLHIEYEDGAGKQTDRVVDVRQCGTDVNGSIIIGHCRMRNATRTFRTDRIRQCIDEQTGEIVDDVFSYLREQYDSSPERTLDTLYEEEYDTLRALLFVGKADGQLRAPEKAIIRETCRVLANDSRITDPMIDKMLSSLEVPSLHAFKLAVGRLAKRETIAQTLLMKAAEDMVATQKTVHPAEKEAVEYIRKRIFEAAPGGDKKNSSTPTLRAAQHDKSAPLP